MSYTVNDETVPELIDDRDKKSKSAIFEKMGSAPSGDRPKRVITDEERSSWDALKATIDVQIQNEKGTIPHPKNPSEEM